MGPVSSIILFIPTITRLKIATERMEQLESEINIKITKPVELEGCDVKMDFYNIRFEDLCYEYNLNEGQNIFALGPVNLTINKGEIIFITGGNGSGKSTFVKLLTGLYQPTSGKIYFNNEELSARPGLYSNQFAAIFTDSYLFLDNYNGFDLREDNPLLEEYTQQMQLKSILEKDSQGRIRTYLSKGQQKRLSMIYALLEQKDLLVLDEWAAEQDPLFRKYFYTEFLPLLRDMGKTIIAITHDDAYFSCADRIIKFNYGRIVSEKHLVERILPPTA
jgi:ABC-type siderophore export system fused ATPase/permease subunit